MKGMSHEYFTTDKNLMDYWYHVSIKFRKYRKPKIKIKRSERNG